MPTKKINLTSRDKARWVGIAAGIVCMVTGVFVPVPLTIYGKLITDNTFLAVGAVGMLLTFGVVQLVKAIKGDKSGDK